MKKKIVVIGCGLAGFWAAVGAARLIRQLKKEKESEVIAFNRNEYHGIRVCYYEDNLEDTQYRLSDYFEPLNIKTIIGYVDKIDSSMNHIIYQENDGKIFKTMKYDKLIIASGSHLGQFDIEGCKFIHNIDTYEAAKKLNDHISGLANSQVSTGQFTAVVIGGGFTGIEIASELPKKLQKPAKLLGRQDDVKVVIINRSFVGNTLGNNIRPSIIDGLNNLGVEIIDNIKVKKVTELYIELEDGKRIDTQTVISTIGVKPSIPGGLESNSKYRDGRLNVDSNLKVIGLENIFAAGDVAAAKVDEDHYSLMTCQHGRPQGRIAGYNSVADLFNLALIPYLQKDYVTVLDMGNWGAIYTEGWSRKVVSVKNAAKKTKRLINHERIRPPKDRDIQKLIELASPEIQALPLKFRN